MPVTPREVIAFLLGLLVSAVLRALGARSVGADGAAVARLERKLDQLLSQSGLSPGPLPPSLPTIQTIGPGASSSDVMQLLRQGKKIQAIKLYREQTGAGLKEAKDAVEQMDRQSW